MSELCTYFTSIQMSYISNPYKSQLSAQKKPDYRVTDRRLQPVRRKKVCVSGNKASRSQGVSKFNTIIENSSYLEFKMTL